MSNANANTANNRRRGHGIGYDLQTAQHFNDACENIFHGLIQDALTDEARELCTCLYDVFTVMHTKHGDTYFIDAFASIVSSDVCVRKCIKEKNSCALEVYLCDCPLFHESAKEREWIHTLFDYLQVSSSSSSSSSSTPSDSSNVAARPQHFKVDTVRKLWKRIHKLAFKADVSHLFATDDKNTTAKKTAKENDDSTHSQVEIDRVTRFNDAYRQFLVSLSTAFPCDDGSPCMLAVEQFDSRISSSDATNDAADEDRQKRLFSVRDEFKAYVLPCVPVLAASIKQQDKATQMKALEPYFGDDCSWFRQLPCVQVMPIETWWRSQMVPPQRTQYEQYVTMSVGERANLKKHSTVISPQTFADWDRIEQTRATILESMAQLAACMSGIDSIIYSPIVDKMRAKAIAIMRARNIDPATLSPSHERFDRALIVTLVKELMAYIPTATDNVVSRADVNTFMANAMRGDFANVPDSFKHVFSPDALDTDCMISLIDVPGVGDVLKPFMAQFEAQMTGKTGAKSPFTSAPTPAWIPQDDTDA